MAQSGDPCPRGCGGRLKVRTSKPDRLGVWRTRYLECGRCGAERQAVVLNACVHSRRR